MSMHLSNIRVTPARRKTTITDKKRKELENNWRQHNTWLKQHHMKTMTFEEYVNQALGKNKVSKKPTHESFKPLISNSNNYRRGDAQHYPSRDIVDRNIGTKPETKVYSGERKLLGIGTMHKSNMVPIFDKESAEDLARMRR